MLSPHGDLASLLFHRSISLLCAYRHRPTHQAPDDQHHLAHISIPISSHLTPPRHAVMKQEPTTSPQTSPSRPKPGVFRSLAHHAIFAETPPTAYKGQSGQIALSFLAQLLSCPSLDFCPGKCLSIDRSNLASIPTHVLSSDVCQL